jgi:hypothetical protein
MIVITSSRDMPTFSLAQFVMSASTCLDWQADKQVARSRLTKMFCMRPNT